MATVVVAVGLLPLDPLHAQESSLPDVEAIYEELELQREWTLPPSPDDTDPSSPAEEGAVPPTEGAGTGPERRAVEYEEGLGRGGTRRPAGGGGGGGAVGGLFAGLLKGLGWIALGVAVVAVLYWIFRMVSDVRMPTRPVSASDEPPSAGVSERPGPRVEAVPVDQCRAAAVAAAERGDPVRAVHILLLGALQLVTGRTHLQLEDAQTSREMLRGIEDGASGRDELEQLVVLTEKGLFAGRPLEAADVDRGLRAYDTLRERRT